jgi:hypothetical protein
MIASVPASGRARPAQRGMSVVLPGPVGAKQREELAALDLERHAIEGTHPAESLLDPAHLERRAPC